MAPKSFGSYLCDHATMLWIKDHGKCQRLYSGRSLELHLDV